MSSMQSSTNPPILPLAPLLSSEPPPPPLRPLLWCLWCDPKAEDDYGSSEFNSGSGDARRVDEAHAGGRGVRVAQ